MNDIKRLRELAGIQNIVYHGDNFGTTKLHAEWMLHGESNNQEGVGIYFTPVLSVAQSYGPKISTISLDNLKIVNSRKLVADVINKRQACLLLKYLNATNDDFWYLISDYIEVTNPDDVQDYHFPILYDKMKMEEIRNWQIELTQASTVTSFVTGWNKYIKIDVLYEPVTKFYAAINTNIQVTPYNF